MELFEEALRRWEQALTFRNRQAEDEACSSIKLGAGDAIAEESVDVRVIYLRVVFIILEETNCFVMLTQYAWFLWRLMELFIFSLGIIWGYLLLGLFCSVSC